MSSIVAAACVAVGAFNVVAAAGLVATAAAVAAPDAVVAGVGVAVAVAIVASGKASFCCNATNEAAKLTCCCGVKLKTDVAATD